MRNLITVDIGNSSIKVGIFDDQPAGCPRPLCVYRLAASEIDSLEQHLAREQYHWRIGSVQEQTLLRLSGWLDRNRPQDRFHVVQYRDLDLKLDVEAPAAVGIDRLAAAVAINQLRDPSQAALAVDIGTTITCDVISPTGVFLGGSIAPGQQLRLDSMSSGTDKLPALIATTETPPWIGRSTEAAMRSGAFWSLITQVEGTVSRMRDRFGAGLETFITGGAAAPMLCQLDPLHRHEPHLVLCGLATSLP